MTLGEKIYQLRTQRGLSQEMLGLQLGVSRQSVSKWETDQSVPDLEKVIALSELFEVSTDYLLKENILAPQETRDILPESATKICPDSTSPARLHYEYKSKKSFRGIPLVHVNFGAGLYRARGIIAIGNLASGIVAIGLLSAGVASLGILTAGLLLALGTVAVGFISFGSLAVGCIAFGAITVGIFCMGAVNFGEFCFGALSYGRQIAVGDEAYGQIALSFSRATGEVYEEVSKTRQFDYPTIERIINENVSAHWFPFREWTKAVLRMMSR